MTEPFLISDERLCVLAATRQGRVSIAGYNYQAAYAVARLAAMSVQKPVLDLQDWPQRLRYDWGEDLDEACNDGTVIFTQCKRVDTIGQPAALADVLTGFAPKWLWVPEAERERLRFRLVSPDRRFATGGTSLEELKTYVCEHFRARLEQVSKPRSDQAAWIAEARNIGYETLFEALWSRLSCLYLPSEVIGGEPAGPQLAAEKEALRVLLVHGRIDAAGQMQVLGRLRRLIHDNLITFDPANQSPPPSFARSPRRLDRADVDAAIDPWRPAAKRQPPFQLVDRTFLSEQREYERQQFVARQPDWSDVAHGHDEVIKFIERDQTEVLEAAVLEKVVARIGRSGRLPALFVVGAPGDGKTTIVRRVAARLIDAGEVLIADTGVGLHEPPGEPDEYVQAIETLQSFGRPVVLLLDDPLYAESPWLSVLAKLNRPGLQVGVLAASPQFLFEEHKSQLRSCEVSPFEMSRISQTERESLATLYGRSVSSRAEDDFLVAAMEAAAGISFRDIIERLWLTLSNGLNLSSAGQLSDLPWQTRAYLFVCFFSRAYEACPEPLLLKLLEMTGGVSETLDLHSELQRMKHFAGWRIFRIGQRVKANFDFQGAPIAAAHTVIARHAWEQRPIPWCDVGDAVIQASVHVPQTVHDVSALGVQLRSQSLAATLSGIESGNFAEKLVARWQHESNIETRQFCDLTTPFIRSGLVELEPAMREMLMRRAQADSQGWLATNELWNLNNFLKKEQAFPAEIDILSVIQSADFSVASGRATIFGQRLLHNKQLRAAFVGRLLDSLNGKLAWSLDSKLLLYLMMIANPEELSPYVSHIKAYLEAHPDNFDIRIKYLSILLRLPDKFSNLQAEAARQTAEWLEKHPEDVILWARYLSFLLSVGSTMPIYEWQQLACDSLNDARRLTFQSELQNHRRLIHSYAHLYLKLLWSLNQHDSEAARKVLRVAHDVAEEWYDRNPLSGPPPYLPLP